jgi:hypothetical protein
MGVAARARSLAAGALRALARRAGHDLVRRDFYSPVPALSEIPAAVFDRRSPLAGIEFDVDAQLAFLQELGPFLAEFEPPRGFVWDNQMYGAVEADVLYAMVRHAKPARVIELGSGFSSLIIAAAVRRNAAEGSPVSYRAYDPYAREFVRGGIEGLEWRDRSATDVPLEEFDALRAGDVLFVDTTHTVKLGSEVNYVVLDVLPRLQPGVSVHFHDVVLPYEYPRAFFDQGLYWAEQYLLQAFLAQNPSWEIVLALHALVRDRPAEVAAAVRSYRPGPAPGAFWIRHILRA